MDLIGPIGVPKTRRYPYQVDRRRPPAGLLRYGQGMTLSAHEWTERFATQLAVAPPTDEEQASLLGLAGVAAHASERTAAPICCWLAARAGIAPSEALRLAKQLAEDISAEDISAEDISAEG